MANQFLSLAVPAGDGVGAATDCTTLSSQRSISVDGGVFSGELVIEGSNAGNVDANFVGLPDVPPFRERQSPIDIQNTVQWMRVRRRGSSGGTAGTPTVKLAGEAVSIPNVFATLAVPAGDGTGAGSSIAAGGAVNTIIVAGDFQGAIVVDLSNDGVNFAPVARFTTPGVVTVPGTANAARVRRFAFVGGGTPVVSIGSGGTAGGGGGGFPGFGGAPPAIAAASSAGATGLASDAGHTHAGTSSVNGATGAATFASAGGTVAITGAAPALNLEVASPFGGFGGAPPAVASASSAGAAATASRSDHTHALDLVAYNPSLAGMQATGMIVQTYGAPTATPSVVAATANQVLFGANAATNLPTSAATFLYNSTNGRMGVGQIGSTFTVANMGTGLFNVAGDTSSVVMITSASAASLSISAVTINRRSRGTLAAPAAVINSDTVADTQFLMYTGAAFQAGMQVEVRADSTSAIGAGQVPMNYSIYTNPTGVAFGAPHFTVGFGGDLILGNNAVLTNATTGFVWLRSTAGVPTGVPTVPAPWNIQTAAAQATAAVPTVWDSADNRLYFNYAAAWHYLGTWDYSSTSTRVPFGSATAGTLTDSASFTFITGTNTLNVNNVASNAGAGLNLAATGAQTLTLQTNGTTRTTISSAGVVTVAGSGAAAPGGTFGNAVWTPANSTLTLGAPGAPPSVGSIFVNTSTGSGIAIGGGLTAGILVRDAGAGGEAYIAADTGFLGQGIVGWQSGALTSLNMVVGPGNLLLLSYNGNRAVSSGTTALQVDGTTGQVAIGASGFASVTVAPNGAGSDVFLGYTGLVAGAVNNGFPYMPNINGAPTGAPNAFGGLGAAFVYDRSSARLWARDVPNATWMVFPAFNTTVAAGAGLALINNAPGAIVSLNAKWWRFVDSGGTLTYIPYYQ